MMTAIHAQHFNGRVPTTASAELDPERWTQGRLGGRRMPLITAKNWDASRDDHLDPGRMVSLTFETPPVRSESDGATNPVQNEKMI